MADYGAGRSEGEREALLGDRSSALHNNRVDRKTQASPRPSWPTFGQWIKQTWPDILTMLVTGAVGQGAYSLPPAPTRSFAVTFSDDRVVSPEFAYPMRDMIIPIWLVTLLAPGIPIAVTLAMQLRFRSFWDANNAVIGVLYSLITAAAFQAILKWLIGGLRPHFLAACNPDMGLIAAAYARQMGGAGNPGRAGDGFGHLYFTREICTGDSWHVSDSLESFPSGHTTAAFAGGVFLSLYLNGKLKLFSRHHTSMWKLVVFHLPILGATLVGGSLTLDFSHNWYDILAGAIIGTTMAFCSYRMVYTSIWDSRVNHIPLRRDKANVERLRDVHAPYGGSGRYQGLGDGNGASHATLGNAAAEEGLATTP